MLKSREFEYTDIKDKLILEKIKNEVNVGIFHEILQELENCESTYNYLITNKPVGKMRQFDEYEYIEGVYVNQTMNGGYTGDEFGGSCSIKIGENRYFEFWYSM